MCVPHPHAEPGAARRRLLGAVAAIALGSSAPAFAADAWDISLEQARTEFLAGRATLIDIREPEEHASGVVEGARLLPMRQLGKRFAEISASPDRPVLLICHTQNRSSATTRALREHGYTHVRFVRGGMREWARRGWPLVKPGG